MKVFLAFAVILPMVADGQVPPAPEHVPFERTEIVKVDSTVRAIDLYRSARRWFAEAFKDSKEVIQFEDTTTRTIVGKGNIPLEWPSSSMAGHIDFTVEVIAKDGRYRVRLYHFVHYGSTSVSLGRVYPATDLGTIFQGDLCYAESAVIWAKPDEDNSHWVSKHCKERIWPTLSTRIEDMLATLNAAMKQTTAPATNGKTPSDW